MLPIYIMKVAREDTCYTENNKQKVARATNKSAKEGRVYSRRNYYDSTTQHAGDEF